VTPRELAQAFAGPGEEGRLAALTRLPGLAAHLDEGGKRALWAEVQRAPAQALLGHVPDALAQADGVEQLAQAARREPAAARASLRALDVIRQHHPDGEAVAREIQEHSEHRPSPGDAPDLHRVNDVEVLRRIAWVDDTGFGLDAAREVLRRGETVFRYDAQAQAARERAVASIHAFAPDHAAVIVEALEIDFATNPTTGRAGNESIRYWRHAETLAGKGQISIPHFDTGSRVTFQAGRPSSATTTGGDWSEEGLSKLRQAFGGEWTASGTTAHRRAPNSR
jgi:hypothetical protein